MIPVVNGLHSNRSFAPILTKVLKISGLVFKSFIVMRAKQNSKIPSGCEADVHRNLMKHFRSLTGKRARTRRVVGWQVKNKLLIIVEKKIQVEKGKCSWQKLSCP